MSSIIRPNPIMSPAANIRRQSRAVSFPRMAGSPARIRGMIPRYSAWSDTTRKSSG
jgi:hypothetical protein